MIALPEHLPEAPQSHMYRGRTAALSHPGSRDGAQRHMPITYVLDKTRKLIRAEVVGSFTAADMLQCVTGAAAEAGEPGWNVISDHRAISHPATRGQLEQLTGQLTEMHRHFAGARWAVVTTNPASFGMMRMLQVLALRVPMELDIFARYEDAERWASVHFPGDSASG